MPALILSKKTHQALHMGVSLLQGLMLLWLYENVRYGGIFYHSPQWVLCFYTIVFAAPLAIMLSLKEDNFKKILIWVSFISLILGAVGYYNGHHLSGSYGFHGDDIYVFYALTMSLAVLMIILFMQQYLAGGKISYEKLFDCSWRIFYILALSMIFTLAFWAILMLWGQLFMLINIKFFDELFGSKYFLYPMLALCNGFGIYLLRGQQKIIAVLGHLQRLLMKYLLVVLILISLVFLIALPFTGIKPLMATKFGSILLLWMQGLILFFLNSTYSKASDEPPFKKFLQRFILVGVAFLPLYSLIISYGLFTRISQYGWTVNRGYGILIWAIFTLFCGAYFWAIIRKGNLWTQKLGKINIPMGFIVFFIVLALNTPLLDLRKITVSSQLARLKSGAASYEQFDYYYFRYSLGIAGVRGLLQIQKDVEHSHPKIFTKLEGLITGKIPKSPSLEPKRFKRSLTVLPKGEVLPKGLKDKIYQKMKFQRDKLYVLAVDLDKDGQKDYLVIANQNYYRPKYLFSFKNNGWRSYVVHSRTVQEKDAFKRAIEENKIEILPHKWQRLKINKVIFTVEPKNFR
jgi:hypothetical protein